MLRRMMLDKAAKFLPQSTMMVTIASALSFAALLSSVANTQPLAPAGADRVELPGATPEAFSAARVLLKNDGTQDAYTYALRTSANDYVRSLIKSGKLSGDAARTFGNSFLLPEMESRVGEMVDMDAEVLASKLSVADIAQLAAFYETPLGVKLRIAKGDILQQSMIAHQVWRDKIFADAWTRFRNVHVPSGFAP